MTINTVCGPLDISINKRFYDISHPAGAIRSFKVSTEPRIEGSTISWTAISDDSYNESVDYSYSVEIDECILIFNDYESAEKVLNIEDVRIQLSSIEYLLLTVIDLLCKSHVQSVSDDIRSVSETFELQMLSLRLRSEIYEHLDLSMLQEISDGCKSQFVKILSYSSLINSDLSCDILNAINAFKGYRNMLLTFKQDLLSYTI